LSKRTYFPDRGDVIHVNLSPSAGREFTGPHYAIVISTIAYARATSCCIVLPTTTKYHAELRFNESQLLLKMPPVQGLDREGFVHVYEIKTIDFRERGSQFVGKVDDDFLIEIMERARSFIDPDSAI